MKRVLCTLFISVLIAMPVISWALIWEAPTSSGSGTMVTITAIGPGGTTTSYVYGSLGAFSMGGGSSFESGTVQLGYEDPVTRTNLRILDGIVPVADVLVTPEPATMLLLGLGLIGLAGVRKFRK